MLRVTAISIRRAKSGDAAAIIEMASALASAVNDPNPQLAEGDIEELIASDTSGFECFIAIEDRRPVGYIAGSRYFEPHAGLRAMRIADLYVCPESRRQGVAKMLLEALRNNAIEAGCSQLVWEVWTENAVALNYFEALGARLYDDVVLMRLPL